MMSLIIDYASQYDGFFSEFSPSRITVNLKTKTFWGSTRAALPFFSYEFRDMISIAMIIITLAVTGTFLTEVPIRIQPCILRASKSLKAETLGTKGCSRSNNNLFIRDILANT